MRGISRRARACAVAAAAGVAVLASAPGAQAQRPASVGDGVPTGQMGVQMFNYGSYISNGGSTGAANPVTGVSTGCLTATTAACQKERLEGLFAFLQRKGLTNIELFGHAGFPAQNDIPGLVAYRALMDKYGLHAGGWHGTVTDVGPAWTERVAAAKILGMDFIGSGGLASPGINTYSNTLLTAQALNRLGKESVEAGVGPVYIHNHQGEWTTKYVDNGVSKPAWQIIMERTDARYVAAEIDAFWSSDAFQDITGEQTATWINNYPTRVQLLHAKDGINVDEPAGGSPRAFGTGEVDYRPIFAAGKNRVRYYHQEQDGGTTTDADISFTNLKGINGNVVGTVLGLPTTFPSVPAGTAAAANVLPVVLSNTGDAPLTITALAIQANALDVGDASDFSIVSQNCTAAGGGGPIAPGNLTATPPVQRGTCTVNIGFKPTRSNYRSVARLQITSGSDNATEAVLLTGKSTADALGGVGGDVPTALSLTLGGSASFGSFVPATARNYDTAVAATVVSTAGDAKLAISDTNATAPGHLVNGTFSLPAALQVRGANAANPNPAYAPLSEVSGTPLNILSYTGPTAGADTVTIGFRQAIGATDTLRAGSYSKTLTFTLSTTTP